MPGERVLVRGGVVIDTDPVPVVRPDTDVLVANGTIAAIGTDLPAEGAEIIEARDRIVLPGFVDTHRHTWQTVLRGVATDDHIGGYLRRVLGTLAPRVCAQDVHIATLAGALECLDAGITTLQDFAHIQSSPDHGEATVAGLREAGIRAVVGFGVPPHSPAPRPADVRRLRDRHFSGERGLLTMALTPFGPSYAPIDIVEADWRLAEELGLPIAVHVGSGPAARHPIRTLRDRGLLRAGTLYVHGNTLPDEELALIADSGGAMSITPAIEARMGLGAPMVDRLRATGVTTGLGVDTVTAVAGDMFSVMRATLITSRSDHQPRVTAADVLRMATMDGANALGLGDLVGSLRPGKQADLVLVRADAVNMLGADHDPIGAVVTAAHPGNVDTVLVAGRIVKRDGRLPHPAVSTLAHRVRESAAQVIGTSGAAQVSSTSAVNL